MAPFRRGHSTPTTGEEAEGGMPKRSESAWAARMRRKKANAKENNNRRNEPLPADEYDPYDSDPGESYREHCDRIKGESGLRSCMALPRFLQHSKDGDTEATTPASPLVDEEGTPASLPRDLARVKYSLRTSISDGSQPQQAAPNLMERRDLRPNNIHINVSHWSEFGGRNYMEDRYVSNLED